MENTLHTMDRHEFFRLIGASVGALLLMPWSAGCAKADDENPTTDPDQSLDFVINLAEKGNESLKEKGGYVIVNNVIVAQTKAGDFVAASSRCTCVSPSGTLLVYKPAENQYYCPLHLSRYDTTGKVVVGPAKQALKQYLVADLANGTLRVHT